MFLGEFNHSLDDKGRLTLPAKFRDQLAQGIVITRGLDGCLFVFTYEDWKRFTSQLERETVLYPKVGPRPDPFFLCRRNGHYSRPQGRVLVPPFLREYANLDSDAVIIGANTRLELWNTERWQETMLDVESNAEEIAEQFSNITF